jgi:O-antigen/teichoic acid export membrane protein
MTPAALWNRASASRLGAVAARVLSLSAAEILSSALSFLVLAYLARALGPHGFGIIAFGTSLVGFFNHVLHDGLNTLGAREIARTPSQLLEYAPHVFIVKAMLSLVVAGALGAVVYAMPQSSEAQQVTLAYGVTLFTAILSPRWILLGLQRFHLSALQTVATQSGNALGVFLLVGAAGHILRVPLIQVAAETLAALTFLAVLARSLGMMRWTIDWAVCRRIGRDALPISASTALLAVNYYADMVMLGFLGDAQALGWYTAASRISLFVLTLVSLYHVSVFPTLARYFDQRLHDATELLKSSLGLSAMAAVPIAVGGSILAEPILAIAFGPEYVAGATAFRLLLWAVAVIIIRSNHKIFLIAFHAQARYLRSAAWSALTNVALNIALIPRFGIAGAATATLVAETVFLVLVQIEIRRAAVRVSLVAPLVKPALAAAVMAFGMHLVRSQNATPIVLFLTGAVGYTLVLVALRPLSRAQLEALRRA